jgi:hypothetical protein
LSWYFFVRFRTSGTKKKIGEIFSLNFTIHKELRKRSRSDFWKHWWILLESGMQVSIGYVIIENKNKVKNPKIPLKIKKSKKNFTTYLFCMFQDLWNKKKLGNFCWNFAIHKEIFTFQLAWKRSLDGFLWNICAG